MDINQNRANFKINAFFMFYFSQKYWQPPQLHKICRLWYKCHIHFNQQPEKTQLRFQLAYIRKSINFIGFNVQTFCVKNAAYVVFYELSTVYFIICFGLKQTQENNK